MKMPMGEEGQWALVVGTVPTIAERGDTVWICGRNGDDSIDFGEEVDDVVVFEDKASLVAHVLRGDGEARAHFSALEESGERSLDDVIGEPIAEWVGTVGAGVYAEVEAERAGIPEAAARALDSAGALCSDIIQGLEMVREDGDFPHAVAILRVVLLRVAAVAVARVEVLDRVAAWESLADAAKAVEGSLL